MKHEMEHIFNIIAGPQADVCCILLYGEIGDYGNVTAQDIVTRLMEAEQAYRKIDIRINSVGGEVDMGIAIFNALRQSKADITIYIDCIAASTASFIAACGRTVKMSRYARMMLHRPSGGAWGDASHLKSYIAQLEQIEEVLCRIYAERTGRTVEDIRATYMDGEDHWLTADEALSLGFVDEIYDDAREVSFSDALSPHERCERYTACYLESIHSHKTGKQMINKLKGMPTFSNCADEAAIINRIAEIDATAAKYDAVVAERDALKTKVADFEQKEREAAEAAYDAAVDQARAEERIGAAEVESFKALMRKDPEATRALLDARKPKRRITDLLGGQAGSTAAKTDKELLAEREAEVRAKLER